MEGVFPLNGEDVLSDILLGDSCKDSSMFTLPTMCTSVCVCVCVFSFWEFLFVVKVAII
jgi:hypothetical protein